MIEKTRCIKDTSKLTRNLPTMRYITPDYVYLPIINTRCDCGEVFVKVGDKVKIGQIIGNRKASFFEQPIHSTVSGEVTGFKKKWHRSGKLLECIEIKNDKTETLDTSIIKRRSNEEINNLTREDYINIIKDSALVGLGGSGFPTYIKMQSKTPVHTILINGIECEPYLTSDYKIMFDMPERVLKGLIYAMKAMNAKVGYICLKKKYKDLKESFDNIIKKRYNNANISVKSVGNYYPQGWEIELIKSALKIKVPSGTLPTDSGVLVLNVSTIVGFYRAIKYNEPVINRYFTVGGDGINYPQSFRLRIGTQIKDLLTLCDGYNNDSPEKVVVLGGPMMGQNLLRDDAIVSKTSTSLIVLNKETYKEEPCIRCASCSYTCPVSLMPVLIRNSVKTKNLNALKIFNVKKCMECGLCSYTCPSKIHLTEFVRTAKRMVK